MNTDTASHFLREALLYMKSDTDEKDVHFLANILEFLTQFPNKYVGTQGELKNFRNQKRSLKEKQIEEVFEMLFLQKFASSKSYPVAQVLRELFSMAANISSALIAKCQASALKIWLSYVNFIGGIATGSFIICPMDSVSDKKRFTTYMGIFQEMKCTEPNSILEVFFFVESLEIFPTYKKVQSSTCGSTVLGQLVEDFAKFQKKINYGFADVICKQWKTQILNTFLNVEPFKKNTPAVVPSTVRIKATLKQFEQMEIDASTTLIEIIREIGDTAASLEKMSHEMYARNLPKREIQTAAALVNLKVPSYQGKIRNN